MKSIAAILLVVVLLAASAGCRRADTTPSGSGRLQVVATIFPLYDFCRAIGGDRADVSMLLPPGVEPHSFEPKPDDLLRINRSSLFIYTNRYLEPWAADVLAGAAGGKTEAVDTSAGIALLNTENGDGHDHGGHDHHGAEGKDPHVWLNPVNAGKMVETILVAFVRRDPANRDYYAANAAAYRQKLADLDRRFREGLSGCRRKTFLHGGHYAFGYLADRYGLTYRAAFAASANAEPTPRQIAELVRIVREQGLHFIFYEEIFSPRMADTIARETGAKLLKLHGIHNVTRDELAAGTGYIALMEQNLRNLQAGLECRTE